MAGKAGARLDARGLAGTLRHAFGLQGSGDWTWEPHKRGRLFDEQLQRFDTQGVIKANDSALYHSRGDSAMPTHGLKSPVAEALLKPRARLAPAGGFQNCLADLEATALEAEQVDAADHQVASQVLGHDVLVGGAVL